MSHLINVLILFLLPIISFFEVRKLKSNISDKTKEAAYLRIYAWYIITLALVLYDKGLSSLYVPASSFVLPSIINLILWTLVSYHTFMLIVPTIMICFKKRMRDAVAAEYKDKEYMIPRSNKSMAMFAVLAVIVGVSEEIIFRGYLYAYFQDQWGFTALLSFIIINVIFGLLHYHQGRSAVIDTMTLGFAMSHLYIKSGSLLLPIIFHILYDLKIVLIAWIIQKKK